MPPSPTPKRMVSRSPSPSSGCSWWAWSCTSYGPKRRPEKADNSPVTPELSIVIPIRNEGPSLLELHRELTDTLVGWGRSYEILIIDDGSTDDSFATLKRLQSTDPHLRVIRF